MSQTSYSIAHAVGYVGGRADSGPMEARAALNKSGSEIPFGRVVVLDTTAGRVNALGPNDYTPVKLISAAGQKVQGALLHDQAHTAAVASGALDGEMCSVLKKGLIYLLTEQAVTPADTVYVRHTIGDDTAKELPGQVRKDRDGVAQVSTYTPTAAEHSKAFGVRVSFADRDYFFDAVSDATMTATEVCDALRLAMAADTEFAARAVASGTTTLILTGQVAGEAFAVSNAGQGAGTWAATTPPAALAEALAGAKFRGTAAADSIVAVEFNLPL